MHRFPRKGDTIKVKGKKEQFVIIGINKSVYAIKSKKDGSEFVCSLQSIEKLLDSKCEICQRDIEGCYVCWWCGFDPNGGPQ